MKRLLKRVVIGLLKALLVIALILALANAGLKYYRGRRVEAHLAVIKAKGQPVSFADLERPSIPDSENGAVVYARIFKLISEATPIPGQPGRSEDTGAYSRILRMSPGELAEHPDIAEGARQVAAQNAKGLALVEEAVSRRICRFPVRGDPAGDEIAYTRYGKVRSLARLLCLRAILEARDGRMDEAVKSLDLGYKVNRSLANEAGIVSFLVRVAVFRMSARTVQTVASYRPFNEQQAKRLFDTISTVDMDDAYAHAFETERVLGLARFQQFKAGMPGCLRYAEETAYLDFMARQIDGASLSYREARSRGLLSQRPEVPFYAQMIETLVRVFAGTNATRYLASADLAEAQVFLALQAYRNKFGSYPKTLDEVRSGLGWKLPEDPFSGRDLLYKPEKAGFLLYSVGPDMKDDRGRIQAKYRDSRHSPGDIVWGSQR